MVANLTFHILSLVAFLALLYFLVRLRNDSSFLVLLSKEALSSESRVLVDWPVRFVAQACRTAGIKFSSDVSPRSLAPEKISVRPWAKLLLGSGVTGLALRKASTNKACEIVISAHPKADKSALEQTLNELRAKHNHNIEFSCDFGSIR